MPLTGLESYYRPVDLQSALDLVRTSGPGARFMAAGTDLVLHGGDEITTLIDLAGLDLSYVEERDAGIGIGAMTTLTAVLEHPALTAYLGGLVPEVLRTIGSPMLRNVATAGGNLIRRQPWSDLVPLFLALGATIRHFDGTEHEAALSSLYERSGHRPDDILIEVILPSYGAGAAAAFEKFTRSAVDIALLNCAVWISIDEGRCTTARVYVGATPRPAAAIPSVAGYLEGKELDQQVIAEAARLGATDVATGDDRRASAAYRTHLVEVGIRRCLTRIVKGLEAS